MQWLNAVRNIDIRKVAYAIGIMTVIEQGIVSGDAPLAGLMSAAAISSLVAWCKLFIWVNGFVLIGHTMTSLRWDRPDRPTADPAFKPVAFDRTAMKAFAWFVLLAGVVLLLAPGVARAATLLPLKAPQLAQIGPYPTNGCGIYYGVNAETSAAPITGGAVGATEIGGDIGGTLGYTCANGSTFWFAEAMADFQNLNGSQNGFSLTGPFHAEQRVGFGSPLNSLLGSLPGINLPTAPPIPGLPVGVTAGSPLGYVYAALNEDDVSASYGLSTGRAWIISPEFGIGMKTHLSNNAEVDTWAGIKLESNAVCLGGGGCPKLSAGPVAGVSFEY